MHAPRAPIVGNSQAAKRSSQAQSQQSLNHLLNFSLPPRVQHVQSAPRRSKKPIHQQVWNKEKFINAQYRFVMKPTGDYTVHFADPDIYFQWQDILQVIIARPLTDDESIDRMGTTTCPICLSPPTAPRMTKCGHVFCYPCILHYLETGNNPKWHRCPICFDSVTGSQLKAVLWSHASASPPPSCNTTLPLRLMQRPQITTLALPRSDTWPLASQGHNDLLPPHEAPFHFLPDIEDLDREEKSLMQVGDDISITFVARAREKCLGMLAKAREMMLDASLQRTMEKKRRGLQEARGSAQARRRRELATLFPVSDEAIVEDAEIPDAMLSSQSPIALPLSSRASRNKRNINPPPHSSSTYYFYQAASGANIFLHPLDIRILLSYFGSYPSFPDNISSTVDDDLRRRCKYLAHLPEGADVVFLEADLESVVGAETLKPFESLLKVRTARRKERAKKDDKRESRLKSGSERISPVAGEDSVRGERASSPAPEILGFAPTPARVPQSGAWGTRSFASAAHSGVVSGTPGQQRSAREERNEAEADSEFDQAWHELEEAQLDRSGFGRGKRARSKKLVLIGGGGRRR
ncbi:hypothetical protein BS47DRAFT_1443831 [Hydnum rufescens UP504]|uniref:RING-type domain-containing protein n=1 Tax=Hydnum rufescens UP504 TaxID=1448309 RepID=A0A9P6B1M5_9AGAM|nr:hypothetical protein BS47DRAFT_1443831 [Hydnum rufescens UP504]